MENIRKERLMICITSLAGIACILQNYFGEWEFWVPVPVFVCLLVLWWFHIAQILTPTARAYLYFAYSMFLVFYHGIHETSLYDVSVSVMLCMATFSMADRLIMLNLIMAEYIFVMGIQFNFLYASGELDELNAFTIMKLAFHLGTVIAMYIFSRITVNGRSVEKERIKEWQKAVNENKNDMEDFLSNISHELRTPVNVINGMTTLLQKEVDRKELGTIIDAGIRLSHQIEDIQDYTELKRGELVLDEENYMCISLINDVVSEFNIRNSNKALELVVDLDPDTPHMLKGDIRKLHKLFRHLMDNAVKFTSKGGIYIRVYTAPKEYGVNLMVEVTDTGCGMTRADMSLVSKGMYQANKKRNRSTGGIGIGLPIVYGIVHKMGGFVNISSKKRIGTTVRLSIPQTVVDGAPCLSINKGVAKDIVFYIKPEKYKIPKLRDFNRNMAVNLARGLKTNLYSASEQRELEHILNDNSISHIFTGQEEYELEHEFLDKLSEDGYKVIVSSGKNLSVTLGRKIMIMPKPLYGFPVVRIINGEQTESSFDYDIKEKFDLAGVRALVVDDEPMNLVVASGIFRDYKMVVDTADGGRDALAKYENDDYDVIFMDHMMPEMDGVETMKRIRTIADGSNRHPIIVALTANALSGAREMFIREGFDGFIAKPIDIAEFERVMKNVLPEEILKHEGRAH